VLTLRKRAIPITTTAASELQHIDKNGASKYRCKEAKEEVEQGQGYVMLQVSLRPSVKWRRSRAFICDMNDEKLT
jgi:hypothetical protein